jgi:hypothetical protein
MRDAQGKALPHCIISNDNSDPGSQDFLLMTASSFFMFFQNTGWSDGLRMQ